MIDDANRLTRGERLVATASALILAFSFIPLWGSYSLASFGENGGPSARFNAWDGAWGIGVKLGLVAALMALALVWSRAVALQQRPFAQRRHSYAVLMGLSTLLLLVAAVGGPSDLSLSAAYRRAAGFDVGRGPLLYVAVILAAVGTYGGYLHARSSARTAVRRGTSIRSKRSPVGHDSLRDSR
jgi:hypothetical protein